MGESFGAAVGAESRHLAADNVLYLAGLSVLYLDLLSGGFTTNLYYSMGVCFHGRS